MSSPVAGIIRAARTAATRQATTAMTIASSIDAAPTNPPIAAPIGKPAKLKDIETANARPIQAGSVRRWRTVNIATSIGPLTRPKIAIATTIAPIPSGRSRRLVPTATPTIGTAISRRSRSRVSSRPEIRPATTPKTPDTANTSPTAASSRPSRCRTMSGTTMEVIPPAMLGVVTEKPRPRIVRLRQA